MKRKAWPPAIGCSTMMSDHRRVTKPHSTCPKTALARRTDRQNQLGARDGQCAERLLQSARDENRAQRRSNQERSHETAPDSPDGLPARQPGLRSWTAKKERRRITAKIDATACDSRLTGYEEQNQAVNRAKLTPTIMIAIKRPVTARQAAESSWSCSARDVSLKAPFHTGRSPSSTFMDAVP